MKVALNVYKEHIQQFRNSGFNVLETSADYHSGYDFVTYCVVNGERVVIAECLPQLRTCEFFIFNARYVTH